jgi:hypothetical protein
MWQLRSHDHFHNWGKNCNYKVRGNLSPLECMWQKLRWYLPRKSSQVFQLLVLVIEKIWYIHIVENSNILCKPQQYPQLTLRWLVAGFHTWAVWVLEQINLETCHVLMVVWHLLWSVRNCASWNMSLETWPSEPITHRNMSPISEWFGMYFNT